MRCERFVPEGEKLQLLCLPCGLLFTLGSLFWKLVFLVRRLIYRSTGLQIVILALILKQLLLVKQAHSFYEDSIIVFLSFDHSGRTGLVFLDFCLDS